jgi:hypothetical protein
MTKAPPIVLLDTNTWISERLLNSVIGSATLHALTRLGGSILVPEVIELELYAVVSGLAAKHAASMRTSADFYRQVTKHKIPEIFLPSETAVQSAVRERLNNLSGILERHPFTLEQAKAALSRVISKHPPCNSNNEQFRDCCIWQCALDTAATRTVHLVSADGAFYEARNRSAGMAHTLRAECTQLENSILLHPNVDALLQSLDASGNTLDEPVLRAAILEAVSSEAIATARERGGFEVDSNIGIRITKHATPKPSLVAMSFSAKYNVHRADEKTGQMILADLTIAGGCSYDPVKREILEVETSEWSISLRGSGGGYFSSSMSSDKLMDLFKPGNFQLV